MAGCREVSLVGMALETEALAVGGKEMSIHFIRGQRVMLDSDLGSVYGVSTSALNQALKRNRDRFPEDFAFQLTKAELEALKSQNVISNTGRGGRRTLPWAFTEHGAIMLASILNSARAIEMSVFVVRAFVQMREMLTSNRQLAAKLTELEDRVGAHDAVIADLVGAIRELLNPAQPEHPARQIGFHVKEPGGRYRTKNKI